MAVNDIHSRETNLIKGKLYVEMMLKKRLRYIKDTCNFVRSASNFVCTYVTGSMNDGWNSDGEGQTEYTPIYSKTFARGGNGRSGATGHDCGSRHGGRSSYANSYKSGVRKSAQGFGGGRFDHNRGQHRDGRDGRESFSGGHNDCGAGCDRTEVLIKACDVGKIIGKGGIKIRELQSESGAHIQVCVL